MFFLHVEGQGLEMLPYCWPLLATGDSQRNLVKCSEFNIIPLAISAATQLCFSSIFSYINKWAWLFLKNDKHNLPTLLGKEHRPLQLSPLLLLAGVRLHLFCTASGTSSARNVVMTRGYHSSACYAVVQDLQYIREHLIYYVEGFVEKVKSHLKQSSNSNWPLLIYSVTS